MNGAEASFRHAALMDAVYRRQRHVYDATRKFYLLGRDRLIRHLDVPAGGSVLELGCGTGRNLVLAAERYPTAALYGLDISAEMLATAARSLGRTGIAGMVRLGVGDATAFDAERLFGRAEFDRIFVSYALSMIPAWERTIAAAFDRLAPEGTLSIVDFGRQDALPRWFRLGLRRWLAAFHVVPRDTLLAVLEGECHRRGAELSFTTLHRGYAVHAIVRTPGKSPT
jgi:S-adenosylmethionine-diacylgycerolhomoserine-N-methlytransferase